MTNRTVTLDNWVAATDAWREELVSALALQFGQCLTADLFNAMGGDQHADLYAGAPVPPAFDVCMAARADSGADRTSEDSTNIAEPLSDMLAICMMLVGHICSLPTEIQCL